MPFLASVTRAGSSLLRHRRIAVTAGTAAAVLLAGGVYAATARGSAQGPGTGKVSAVSDSMVTSGSSAAPTASATPVTPLRLLSVSPANGTRNANGGAQITLTFSADLSPVTPLPVLSPKIAGRWQVAGSTATFTPDAGFLPGTRVTVTVPGGKAGVSGLAASAGPLAKTTKTAFTTGAYSELRLQQLLTQLGYLPLTWKPAASDSAGLVIPAGAAQMSAASTPAASLNAQVSAAYSPPAGSFTFQPGYPAELTRQWQPGKDNMLVNGAVRAFQSDQGLTMDGVAGPDVWSHLLTAAVRNQVNKHGYSYALATQDSPHETLKVWHNGKLILNTPANTGIPAANTQDGTFPVYLRLQFQVMKGTNPDGSKYADPVHWIAYFNGGDAVHYFDRPGYGYYQSLGCVELPWTPAKYIWPYLTYGTLVTVTGPEA